MLDLPNRGRRVASGSFVFGSRVVCTSYPLYAASMAVMSRLTWLLQPHPEEQEVGTIALESTLCKSLICLLMVLALAFATRGGLADDSVLDSKIEAIMDSWETPGIAIAVVKDDQLIEARGYGVRELGGNDKVDEQTIFGIGSMSKSFATGSVALVIDDAKATWDDPVVKHLPWFELYDPWVTAHATLRDFASHKLGTDSTFVWGPRTWDRREIVRRARHIKPLIDFRQGFVYANVTMMTLGEVVEAATGLSWEHFVQSRIFNPLGMKRSFTIDSQYVEARHMAPCWVCEPPAGAILGKGALKEGFSNVASPHGYAGGKKVQLHPWRYDSSGPAGSIASTVTDVAQWLRLHINQGVYNGNRIMSEAQMWQIHKPQNAIPGALPNRDNPPAFFAQGFELDSYGFGWWVRQYRGHTYNVHGGGQVGYGTLMAYVPEAKLGVVVMQNLNWRESFAYAVILRTLVDHHLGLPAMDWNAMAHENRDRAVTAADTRDELFQQWIDSAEAPSLALANFAGSYESELLGPFTVTEHAGGLTATFDPLARANLEHLGHNRFLGTFRDPMVWKIGIRFEPDADGSVRRGTLGGLGGINMEYPFVRVE